MSHDGPDMTYEPDPRFEWCGTYSRKIRCKTCGSSGYPVDGSGWMKGCLRGHAPCRGGCGRVLTVLLDGSPRAHPGGCVRGGGRPTIPHHIITALAIRSALPEDVVEARIIEVLELMGQKP